MNPLQIMEAHREEFSPNEKRIYTYISSNIEKITQMTTSALAEECGVSQPALSRFIKSMGFARYQDFRGDLIAWLAHRADGTAENGGGRLGYFVTLEEVLDETEKLLTDQFMRSLVNYLHPFKRIFATGMAKSYQSAMLLEILTRKTGWHIHAVSRDSLEELCDFMAKDDLLVVYSVSAKPAIMEGARAAPNILLVTATPGHKYADVVSRQVLLPYTTISPEDSPVSPVLFNIFTELLADYLLKEQVEGGL